jgi:hypothetical protein
MCVFVHFNIKLASLQIAGLKRALVQKDDYYRAEMIRTQTNTDRDIMELRRLMDKIDMCHHTRFEKLVQEHETELGKHKLCNCANRFSIQNSTIIYFGVFIRNSNAVQV